ncbi:MAG: ATP-dependent helicase HrpB [Halothiobacillaceae bacterium]
MTGSLEQTLPALRQALETRGVAILVAQPGAGKTTRVPLALRASSRASGANERIVVLQPRRLAARLAAEYMAATLGERVGEQVGYRVREARRVGPKTRVELVTEGVFLRSLQSDPALEGVGTVIFDEFHLRRVDSDLALAMLLQVREILRPDLRLLIMSATLDDRALAALLGDPENPAPVLRAEGRQYPVDVRHRPLPAGLGRPDGESRLRHATRVICDALREEPGSLLVFLPGEGEIRRLATLLQSVDLPDDVRVHPLYGRMSIEDQEEAVRPSPAGRRKVVLATDIAETSLTIEGIRGVVDLGLSRRARYDSASGLSRLVTVSASAASATQRAGRAGRMEPGFALRLWSESGEPRAAFDEPAIRHADLMPLALELAQWGVSEVSELHWVDPPPQSGLERARTRLQAIGLLDAAVQITDRGVRALRLPLHPRLGAMVDQARSWGLASLACDLAALIEEPPRRGGPELSLASESWDADPERAAARRLAERLRARLGVDAPDVEAVDPFWPGLLAAIAFPDRVAQARGARGAFRLASGRGARLAEGQWLAGQPWLVAVSLADDERVARIRHALPLDIDRLAAQAPWLFRKEESLHWDAEAGAVVSENRICLGQLIVRSRPSTDTDPSAVAEVLCDAVASAGLSALPINDAASRLLERIRFLRKVMPELALPDVSVDALERDMRSWLLPHLIGMSRLSQLTRLDLATLFRGRLDWRQIEALDRLAPERIAVPSGERLRIDYSVDPPVLAVRLQALFGLSKTPAILDGGFPLVLHLLSPAGRPVQVTRDLASFWQNGYSEVRKDLRGRYPKHAWPEDPLTAEPTRGARRRGAPARQ